VGVELALDLVARLRPMVSGLVLAPTTDPAETVAAIVAGS
jgi:hypothetical protein